MKHILPDFSDALQQIMDTHHLSITALTDLLGYKSKTTLVRALNRSTGERGLKKLLTDLKGLDTLSLSVSECKRLENGLLVSANGEEDYLFNKELSDLIFYAVPGSADHTILQQGKMLLSLHEFFEQLHYASCKCLLLNSCFPYIVSELHTLLVQTKEGSSITHYVYYQNDIHRMINALHASLPLLQSNLYRLYSLHPQTEEHSIMGDMIVISCQFEDGSSAEYEIILHNETSGIITKVPGCYEKWCIFLEHYKSSRETLKTLSNSDHIFSILDMYAQLESNNDMYKLKRDLCIAYVPDSIQRAALLDGCKSVGFQVPDEMVEAMAAIQKRRYENICNTKHVKHLVLSQSAMEAFVQTGRLSDHFYLMRPFNVCERIEILSSCINQMNSNPFYHVYFLKKEVEEKIVSNQMVELICFDRQCVQIIPSITDYNLAQGHTEIFIEEPHCVHLTKNFFQKQLFKNYVTSYQEACSIMNEFLSELSDMLLSNHSNH